MSLVNVTVMGSIVRDPEQFTTRNGNKKATVTVAIKGAGSGKTDDGKYETEFYKVETWGKLADLTVKYLSKGSYFGATGRLVLDKWLDKTGRERVTPVVRAEQISLPPLLRVVQAEEVLSDGTNPSPEEPYSAARDGGEDDIDELLGVKRRDGFIAEHFAESAVGH